MILSAVTKFFSRVTLSLAAVGSAARLSGESQKQATGFWPLQGGDGWPTRSLLLLLARKLWPRTFDRDWKQKSLKRVGRMKCARQVAKLFVKCWPRWCLKSCGQFTMFRFPAGPYSAAKLSSLFYFGKVTPSSSQDLNLKRDLWPICGRRYVMWWLGSRGGHLAYVSRAPNLYPSWAKAAKRPQVRRNIQRTFATFNFIEFILEREHCNRQHREINLWED